AIRAQTTVALSGEAADEVFGGYSWFHDADVVASDTFPWLAARTTFAGAGPGSRESLLDRGLLDKLDLDGYRDARYREALAEVPYLAGQSGPGRRMRGASSFHLT